MKSPIVFISYSYDTEAHVSWVTQFASRLRGDGIDVSLDRWNLLPGEHIIPWIEKQIQEADCVLVICTPAYKRRAEARTGGVGFESAILTGDMFALNGRRKTIPILREGESKDAIPNYLLGLYALDFRGQSLPEKEYSLLLRTLLGKHERPPLVSRERIVSDIFGTVGRKPSTTVIPQDFEILLAYVADRSKALVVEGPSGIGKTTAVSLAFEKMNITANWLHARDVTSRERLLTYLSGNFPRSGYWVIDDFHILPEEDQSRVSNYIKLASDLGVRDQKIVIIGINRVGHGLLESNYDLAGRIDIFRMTRQPDSNIYELIQRGEDATNIAFRQRDEFVSLARGSFFVAQLLCYTATIIAGISTALRARTVIDVDTDKVIKRCLMSLEYTTRPALSMLVGSIEPVSQRGAAVAVLWLLAWSEEACVYIWEAKYRYADKVEGFDSLVNGGFAASVQKNPLIGTLLYFDHTSELLCFDDPRLQFYLRNMDWTVFGRSVGLQLTVQPGGGLVVEGPTSRVAIRAVDRTPEQRHTSPTSSDDSPPRVFISYSWDDDDYREWVESLAARLVEDGVDVRLDSWHAKRVTIPQFMSREVRLASVILMLCTPRYKQKVYSMEDEEKSSGVGWEAMLITAALFNEVLQGKVVPVLTKGSWNESVPSFALAIPGYDLSRPNAFEDGYLALLREIYDERKRPPKRGPRPENLAPKPVNPLRESRPLE